MSDILRKIVFAVAVGALVFSTTGVEVENGVSALKRAKNQFSEFNYNKTVELCSEIIESSSPAITEKTLLLAHELRGRAYFTTDRRDKAREDFRAMVKLSPEYKMNEEKISPKIISFFDKIREETVNNLKIESKPGGAKVYLKGEKLGTTPLEVVTAYNGVFTLKFVKKGYRTLESEITLKPGESLERSFELVPTSREVQFLTIPPGVKVYRDGKKIGKTSGSAGDEFLSYASDYNVELNKLSAPLKIRHFPEGKHLLKFKKNCYGTKKVEIDLKVDKEKNTPLLYEPVVLEEKLASLKINSPPGDAKVIIDGELEGRTPIKLEEICAQSRKIRIKKSDIGVWFDTVYLPEGELIELDVSLRPTIRFAGIFEKNTEGLKILEHGGFYESLTEIKTYNIDSIRDRFTSKGPDSPEDLGNMLIRTAEEFEDDLLIAGIKQKSGKVTFLTVTSGSGQIEIVEGKSNLIENIKEIFNPWKTWLGINSVDTRLGEGSYIIQIIDSSPAENAGLESGDIINVFEGEKINTTKELRNHLNSVSPGRIVKLGIKGKDKDIDIKIGRTPFVIPINDRDLEYNILLAELKNQFSVANNSTERNVALLNYAVCLMHYKRWEGAIKTLKKVAFVERNGISTGTAKYLLGLSYIRTSSPEKARKAFKYAKNHPESTLESDSGPSVSPLAEDLLSDISD